MIKAAIALFLAAAPARAYDTIHFGEPISSGEMQKPVAAAVAERRIYVLDSKKDALLIFQDGKFLKSVGGRGDGANEFKDPAGVAVAPDGRVFVADSGNSRVQVLDGDGRFLWRFGSRGGDLGFLKNPQSVAVAADGRVFVSDTDNSRIEVFTRDGVFLYGLGSGGKQPGQFKGPTRVAVDPSDNVYVLDEGNGRIQKFDAALKYIREFSLRGTDFVVDSYGYFYVLDPKNAKVIEQNPEGALVGKFGTSGKGAGQYKKPEAIAIDAAGALYVVDTGNKRIAPVEVSNKLKIAELPVNRAAKLFITGPAVSWPIEAGALASDGEALYAYLPKEGKFGAIDGGGHVSKRFGTNEGKAPSATRGASGLAVSRKLGIYVSDGGGNRLQAFSPEGKWKANIAESEGFFDSRKKEGRVKDPRGVAINDKGTVYVADAGNRRIDAFSPDGGFLFAIGPALDFELKEPSAVVWDNEGFLYFSDRSLKRIFKCEPSGALIASWGEEGSGPGQLREPVAMAYDGNGYLYVLDAALNKVAVFTRSGQWMTDFFSAGSGDRQLAGPAAIAVIDSRLLIADNAKDKSRIVGFDLHPMPAAPAAVAVAAKEGALAVSWQPVADPWVSRYHVLRATASAGPFVDVGVAAVSPYKDSGVVANQKYYYRVAAESKTKDLGASSAAVEIVAPAAFNKSPVEISTVAIDNIFSANYKWYLKNPAGKAVISNNVNEPFENVKVTFRLKDFMDFGYDTEIKRLDPQQKVEVPLIATLNNRILEVTEDTPIQAEFTLTYFESGKEQKVSVTKPLRVYSRNAITWDNPPRIANFITPKDPPILEFARGSLLQAPETPAAEGLNANLVTAMHLWDALGAHGVQFFANPNNPYEKMSADSNFPVDYTQFPRETLKRKSGQCDDLTTLLAAMLEGAKVRTAILDYPGHMALMFDTESDDLEGAGLPESDLIKYDGTYWVPLETTMVGAPFPEALRKAASAYRAEEPKGGVHVLEVRKAWGDFEPATMPASEWNAEVPALEARQKRFEGEAAELSKERYGFLKGRYAGAKDTESLIQLGLLEYQSGHKEAGVAVFNKALALDPKNSAALNNLGNVDFLTGKFKEAEAKYLKASESDDQDPEIWLNLAKTELKLGEKAKAKDFADRAVALDVSLASAVETLIKE